MSDRLNITRRDFLNGIALGVAAGSALSPLELLARDAARGAYYPPALTGMRGSHPGSFEVAHALTWNGATWPRPERQTDADYDLVVVGGGISGLAAAFFYRQRAGRGKRVLILDNHDDFGGHAKRNEFTIGGERLIGYGGSQSIDTPGQYSSVAKQLLKDIGVDTGRFYDYFDRDFFAARGLRRGVYFCRETYGEDRVAPSVLRDFDGSRPGNLEEAIARYPLPEHAKHSLLALLRNEADLLPEHGPDEKVELLRRTSYCDYLRKYAAMPEEVVLLLRDEVKGYWGIGWDALSALEGYRLGMPGTAGLAIGERGVPAGDAEPYIFHFPDGNAGVARTLVRQLIPEAVPGGTMEDIVTARVAYGRLDRRDSDVRIRLLSTGIDVRHTGDGKAVDVTYVRQGEVERVRGRHVVLACYNSMIPQICGEVPEEQKEAIAYATKVPLAYISVGVRNWRAFDRLGFHEFYAPQADLMHAFGMDFPVSIGRYEYTDSPDDPAIVHGVFVPASPGRGLSAREQHVAGRRRLYEMSFDDFERDIVRQMQGALAGGGFDAGRDIAAITVNRWPHGYAYEYNDYYDPPDWDRHTGPHIAGRAPIGRISIANSDAAAYAFLDGAIDSASRAITEQLGVGPT